VDNDKEKSKSKTFFTTEDTEVKTDKETGGMGDKEQLQHQSQNLLITARGHELAKLLLPKLSDS